MQHVKKWLAAVLALALTLAPVLSTTAFAAVDGTGFSDGSTNDWYAEAVMYCHENELMGGTGSNAFSPNAAMTRAMLATVLWRIADEPVVNYLMQFSDVAGNDWWGQAPRIISTFLERYDFSGKTIVPFCTSGSSGIGSSATNLHSLTNGATWLDGQRFRGGTSRDAMIEWVNGLNLGIKAN